MVGGFDQLVDTAPHNARHRGDWIFYIVTIAYKNWPDKVVDAEVVFARQGADGVGAA